MKASLPRRFARAALGLLAAAAVAGTALAASDLLYGTIRQPEPAGQIDPFGEGHTGAFARVGGHPHPVHQALHHGKAQPRPLLLRRGGKQGLHGLLYIGDAAPPVPNLNDHPVVRQNPGGYVHRPQGKPTEDVTITSITVSGTPAESEAA